MEKRNGEQRMGEACVLVQIGSELLNNEVLSMYNTHCTCMYSWVLCISSHRHTHTLYCMAKTTLSVDVS